MTYCRKQRSFPVFSSNGSLPWLDLLQILFFSIYLTLLTQSLSEAIYITRTLTKSSLTRGIGEKKFNRMFQMHYFLLTVNILDFNSLSDMLLFHGLVSLKPAQTCQMECCECSFSGTWEVSERKLIAVLAYRLNCHCKHCKVRDHCL